MNRYAAALAACLLTATACSGNAGCEELNNLLGHTYGFHPSALDSTQRVAKAAAMDSVWARVRARPNDLVPCLRTAIETRTDDHFFQFDATALLVSVDSSRAAKELQVAALARTELRDVELADWVHSVTQRALGGFNTVRAATKWLDLPDSAAKYYLPEHGAYRVSKSDGALILFGSLPESLATPYLISVARDTRAPSREIAVWLLTVQATPEARQFLEGLSHAGLSSDAQRGIEAYLRGPDRGGEAARAPRISRDEFIRAFQALRVGNAAPFIALVVKVPDGEKDAALVLTVADLPDVRFARRYFIASGTPESVGYYGDFTGIIESVLARRSKASR